MPKASKSSASSGTRKKHARKAGGASEVPPIGHQTTKSKPSKKAIKKGFVPPPKKSYIPPSKLKPTPPQIDPLDGLGSLLPAELVVVLRRLSKKDTVTKGRALEELEVWVRKAKEETVDDPRKIEVLVVMLPVWLHRFPALCVHSSRRIRQLTASLHAQLLEIPDVRTGIIVFLRDTGEETHVSQILGSWCLSAWDVDRAVASRASKSWKDTFLMRKQDSEPELHGDSQLVLDDSILVQSIVPFIVTTIMDPTLTYTILNPSSSSGQGDSTASSHTGTPHHASPGFGGVSGVNIRKVLAGQELTTSSRGEDDPESNEDRNARLRVGGVGGLRWLFDTCKPTSILVSSLHSLISSPLFWTVLHPAVHPPYIHSNEETEDTPHDSAGGFGSGQTIVRRAGWGLVHALVGGQGSEKLEAWVADSEHASEKGSVLGLISSAILRSAFVEPDPVVRSSMWEPLLIFLTKNRAAWILSCNQDFGSSGHIQHHVHSDESESEPEVDETESPSHPNKITKHTSTAYTEFLTFLGLGCNGSPLQGYPTILVIFSTIPREILSPTLEPLLEFFDALWSAIDGQALSALAAERAKSTEAFLGAWGECLVWISGRLMKGSDMPQEPAATDADTSGESRIEKEGISLALVGAQFAKLCKELGKSLRVDARSAGVKIASVLDKINQFAPSLLNEAWKYISEYATAVLVGSSDEIHQTYVLFFLATLYQHLLHSSSRQGLEKLILGIANDLVTRYKDPRDSGSTTQVSDRDPQLNRDGKALEILLEKFSSILDSDEMFTQNLNSLMITRLSSLISQPSLILRFLAYTTDQARRLATWHAVLSTIGSQSSRLDFTRRTEIFGVILDATIKDEIRGWARPQGNELKQLTEQILHEALLGDTDASGLFVKLLRVPAPFIDIATAHMLVTTVVTTLNDHIQQLIQGSEPSLDILRSSLELLLALEQDMTSDYLSRTALDATIPRIFVLGFVFPPSFTLPEEFELAASAVQLWKAWRSRSDDQSWRDTIEEVKRFLRSLILDTNVRPRPVAIMEALLHVDPTVNAQPLIDVVPTPSEFNGLLSFTSTDPIDPALAIIEPLAPPFITQPSTSRKSNWNKEFDEFGFSPYARGVSALLYVFTTDRSVARENLWALQHVLTLALFASEVLQVPEVDSPVFEIGRVAKVELKDITRKTQGVATFLLASAGEEVSWHRDVVGALSGRSRGALGAIGGLVGLTSRPGPLDAIGKFVRLVFEQSLAQNFVRDSLILHTVLQHILPNSTKEDADLWIDLARSLEVQAFQTSLAISLAVTEFAPEPPKLDRYRNELASKISGISPSRANSNGLQLLRCLASVAPNPESEVIFLPQERARNLVRAFQDWLGSDEDIDEAVESEITLMLSHLAPILQGVPGAHWEFTMDLIETNIENSSFKDVETHVILSRTFRLLTAIQDLTPTNKYLREMWTQRSKTILVQVRDLLTVKSEQTSLSVPQAICREQALAVVQGLPESLMDQATLPNMCHLLSDPSSDNKKMAYQMLQKAAVKRTEYFVIEAGVDTENSIVIDLPPELTLILQSAIDFDNSESGGQEPLTYLLAWMLTFDLFGDASLKVKTAYVDQLRNLNLIGEYFLPNVFEILGVGASGGPFKLDFWVVDEYWLHMYDADAPQSLQVLAAHVYYRALVVVPSLIRTWWEDLKDRQLSTAITSFTSSYFSPILIASELIDVKPAAREAATEPLTDDVFSIKVASAVNEVTAVYSVDDQALEIAIKLPTGYPLKAVEIRPIRRVGVSEKVWRRWLFIVQQVVTSNNGRIVDGVTLFKKTISLHFEGQEECPICYSILHIVDRSLPSKPCKTCKNRFHAGCLYKWFNTSHSSTCPLCRSDMT